MYHMVFVRIFLILASLVFAAVLLRRRVSAAHRISFCLAVLSADMFLFAYLPMPSYRYDTVSITALGEKNDAAWGNEAFLKFYSVWGVAQDFPEISSGQWFWDNGIYCWREESDGRKPGELSRTIELKLPAGVKRELVFSGNPWRGLVEISCGEFSERVDMYAEEEQEIRVALPDASANDIRYNEWMKTLYILALHMAVSAGVFLIGWLWVKYAAALCRYRYEIVFFVLSVFLNIKYTPYPGIHNYGSTQYLIGYEFGFVKRGLLGEIVTALTPYLQQEALVDFKLYFKLFVFLGCSILLGRIVKRQDEEGMRWFFCLLLLSLPSTYFFAGGQDMRNDVYPMILFVVSAVLIAKGSLIWMQPILMTQILLLNETSVACLLPPLFAMLLYKYVKNGEKKNLAALLGGVCCVVPLSLIFMFRVDPRTGYDAAQVINHVQLHAGFPIDSGAVNSDFFPLSKHLGEVMPEHVSIYGRWILLFFLMMMPAAFICIVIGRVLYGKLVQRAEFTWGRRISFFILMASVLCGFAPMIIAYDYSRYCSFMINAALVVLFFIICEEGLQIRYDELRMVQRCGEGFNFAPIAVCTFYLMLEELGARVVSMPNLYKYVNFFAEWMER